MTTDGIDVSHYQATTPNLAGLDFLFARATYSTYPDDRYRQHIAAAKAAGLVTGAYHFGVNYSPAAQVSAFLAAAGDVDLYVLDLEADGDNPRMTDDQARAFIAGVKAKGHKCGLYHSDSGFPSLGQDWNWVANWSNQPSRAWTFWQYHGGPLDLDRYNGTVTQLRAFAGATGGASVYNFSMAAAARAGHLTLKGDTHSYLRLSDGTLHGPVTSASFGTKRAVEITLSPPIPGGAAGADRASAYLIGDNAAAVLRSDANFTPDPVGVIGEPVGSRAAGYADAKTKAIGAVQTI